MTHHSIPMAGRVEPQSWLEHPLLPWVVLCAWNRGCAQTLREALNPRWVYAGHRCRNVGLHSSAGASVRFSLRNTL